MPNFPKELSFLKQAVKGGKAGGSRVHAADTISVAPAALHVGEEIVQKLTGAKTTGLRRIELSLVRLKGGTLRIGPAFDGAQVLFSRPTEDSPTFFRRTKALWDDMGLYIGKGTQVSTTDVPVKSGNDTYNFLDFDLSEFVGEAPVAEAAATEGSES